MMKRFLCICLVVFAAALSLSAKPKDENNSVKRPKLVVGVVVDQMRWDYLYRYYDLYGNNGFKRLLNNGFSCENTMLNYVPTTTAAGHSCIYTGTVPSIHGIAGNNFMIERTGKRLYCTDDSTVISVGSDSKAGQMSPRNLLVSTVTDELRLATNFKSKTIGVALKDRGAILPAGHTANAAYWFDDKSGSFISSTYYMKELPEWAKDFNKRNLALKYINGNWNTLLPIDKYDQSTADNTPFETPWVKGQLPVFPVKTSELYKTQGYGVIRSTPYGNTLTLDMAKAALQGEQLGADEVTDFLAVSLSSTDYVGHQFGINAIETEDTYLRLDLDIANFLQFLDEKIGKGQYVFFLTADHGAAHNVGFMKAHELPAGAWQDAVDKKNMEQLLKEKFNLSGIITGMGNYQIHLNRAKIEKQNVDFDEVKKTLVRYLEELPGVAYAIDMEKSSQASVPTAIKERVINGYNRERSGAIQVIMKPGWYESYSSTPTGTTHAVWNPYDSHIPLLFYGWGIESGHSNQEVYMTDIAPTVAALLHIQMPNGCIGKPIETVIK